MSMIKNSQIPSLPKSFSMSKCKSFVKKDNSGRFLLMEESIRTNQGFRSLLIAITFLHSKNFFRVSNTVTKHQNFSNSINKCTGCLQIGTLPPMSGRRSETIRYQDPPSSKLHLVTFKLNACIFHLRKRVLA